MLVFTVCVTRLLLCVFQFLAEGGDLNSFELKSLTDSLNDIKGSIDVSNLRYAYTLTQQSSIDVSNLRYAYTLTHLHTYTLTYLHTYTAELHIRVKPEVRLHTYTLTHSHPFLLTDKDSQKTINLFLAVVFSQAKAGRGVTEASISRPDRDEFF